MIGNVQLNAATKVNAVSKLSEDIAIYDKRVNDNNVSSVENEAVAARVTENTDKVEISNIAHTASQNSQIVNNVAPASRDFMEVFSVNFWSRGTEK